MQVILLGRIPRIWENDNKILIKWNNNSINYGINYSIINGNVNWSYLALSRDKTRALEKRNKFSGSTQCEE